MIALSQEEYVDAQGLQCPYCQVFDTELINDDPCRTDLSNHVRCCACGKTWFELLKVVGWELEAE
jgi:hypothetical protein